MKPLTGAKLATVQESFSNSELSDHMTGNRYRVKMSAVVFDIIEPHFRHIEVDLVVTSSKARAESVVLEQIRREFNAVAVWRDGNAPKVEAVTDDK